LRTVGEIIESVFDRFDAAGLVYGHGTDNAWDEAVALVLTVAGCADDLESLARSVTSADLERIDTLAAERIRSRMPLAYLLGKCTYAGHEFLIEPGIMVPRSPIAHLLPDALRPWIAAPKRVLDLCAGSGCIGLVAAHCYPEAEVTLVELNEQAARVAERNVELHGLGGRVIVIQDDVATVALEGRWDLILSNPPYVDAKAMASLPPEYLAEPPLGLAAGADGLAVVDLLLARVPDWLEPSGVFVCEVGASASAFAEKYPDLPVVWFDLPQGGEGVFLLEASGFTSHTPRP
jgi:ribosomal protein L3 glutamine methyltransferase